jgi:hypothetical protein
MITDIASKWETPVSDLGNGIGAHGEFSHIISSSLNAARIFHARSGIVVESGPPNR